MWNYNCSKLLELLVIVTSNLIRLTTFGSADILPMAKSMTSWNSDKYKEAGYFDLSSNKDLPMGIYACN